MFALVVALAATIVLTPTAFAQNANQQYTVWSSVVFQRTGERTPEIVGDGSIPTVLTSIGANQAYEVGQWFRSRYIDSQISSNLNGTDGAFDDGAPLFGLNADIYSNLETYAMSLDQQWNVGTATAFLQGLYPPFSPGSNSSVGSTVDPTSWTSNNSYVEAPLNGYQYPQIHTTGGLDPNFIYLSGNLDCPAFDDAAANYATTTQFSVTQEDFDGIYDAIGSAVLEGVLPPETWDYSNAYAIYDFLQYQYNHNSSAKTALDRYRDVKTNTSYLDILYDLASQQQYAYLGNLTAPNDITGQTGFPTGATGSISTIGGNFLAAKILSLLRDAISYQGEYYKLNLLFADFYPLLSFFALTQLPTVNPDFASIPLYGSSAVFELFSYVDVNSTATSFPDPNDLWVAFYFRNGTPSDGGVYQSYSLFDLGPSQSQMTWNDFQQSMGEIVVSDLGDWCTLCGSVNLFCEPYNSSAGDAAVRSWLDGHGVSTSNGGGGMKPAVAGVIGAIIALGIAGLLFAGVVLIGGVRFHRNKSSLSRRRRQSDLGGFKGGRKMASDQDLTIPKGGAVVGASVEESPQGGHERVGSWELKQAEAGRMGGGVSARPSMEQREHQDPFQDPHHIRPTTPHERV